MHRALVAATTPAAARVTTVVAVAGAAIGALVAPTEQSRRHYDHIAYEATIGFVRDGAGIYQASVDGLAVIDTTVDQVRAMRQPWIFALWAAIPDQLLITAFFGVVVLGSTLLAIRLVTYKPLALLVGAWLATAGVFHGVDAWLLFELWTVPLILGAALAFTRGNDWIAALCCVGACGLRETAVLLPLGFLVDALVRRRSPWPWLAALGTSAAILALHWVIASGYLDPDGASAPLMGTGSASAVLMMTSFLVTTDTIGFLVWVAGVVLLWRSILRPTVLLALMPLVGLLVNRPYWGFMAMPLCLVAIGGLPRREEAPA